MRKSLIERNTKETKIKLSINLDGKGVADINTGIGFFDHMLTLFACHSGCDLTVKAEGDLNVDCHHTVEDVAICLGKAIRDAVGEKKGIARYGFFFVPMDESLARVALDLSGRPFLVFDCAFDANVGDFDLEMINEFFYALAVNSGMTLHIKLEYGSNNHHKAEAIFKAFARAFKCSIAVSGNAIPSSKGALE